MPVGRFAPTPSGPLHLGSLVTAVASYCEAKSRQGEWLLRIEDLDTPRVVKGADDEIFHSLEAFGFEWDRSVLYQSQQFDHYEAVVQELLHQGQVYPCSCSRKSLQADNPAFGPLGLIYPGHCRSKNLLPARLSLRLNLENAGVQAFSDPLYGEYQLNLTEEVGDSVIKRVDGVYAYHLAVTVDDAMQQVDHIVRGVDLLEVTTLHLYYNQLLGFDDAEYLHLPLVTTDTGKKLSKQTGATAIDSTQAAEQLVWSLRFLGQTVDSALTEEKPQTILKHAVGIWDPSKIPANHAGRNLETVQPEANRLVSSPD